jgi:hypothetical protein
MHLRTQGCYPREAWPGGLLPFLHRFAFRLKGELPRAIPPPVGIVSAQPLDFVGQR